MVATIYLIRHGRTALNAASLLRGQIDEPLDDTGRSEASCLAAAFSTVPLKRVVSSPLKRSLDTARAIAERHGLRVNVNASFADRDYGPWAGRPQKDVEERYGSVDGAPANEVEPSATFERRIVAALEDVVVHSEGRVAAVVAHDAVNRALIRIFCSTCPDAAAELPQPTGCWNRLLFDGRCAICDVVGALPGAGIKPDGRTGGVG